MKVKFEELIRDVNGNIENVLFRCNHVGIKLDEYMFIEIRFPNKFFDYYIIQVIERIRAGEFGWMDDESKEAYRKASEIKRVVIAILNRCL